MKHYPSKSSLSEFLSISSLSLAGAVSASTRGSLPRLVKITLFALTASLLWFSEPISESGGFLRFFGWGRKSESRGVSGNSLKLLLVGELRLSVFLGFEMNLGQIGRDIFGLLVL